MTKQVMNMQLSQYKIGVVKGSDYEDAADNVVELGFRPALLKGIIVDDSDDPLHHFWWYSVDPDEEFTLEDTDNGAGFDNVTDNFLTVTENGFILDGTEAGKLNGTPAGFIFEAVGGNRIDAECPIADEAHPDAVDANTAMDTTDYLPEL